MNCSVIGLAAVAVASSAVAQDRRVRVEVDTLACRDLKDLRALDRAMIQWAVRGTIDYPRMRDAMLSSGECKYIRNREDLTIARIEGPFTCLRYVGEESCYWADRPKLK